MAFRKKRGKSRKVARKANPSPRVITKYKYRTRSASKGQRKRKRGGRRRKRSSATAVAAGVGSAFAGAAIGALANESGLLYAAPTQNKTGISLIGWIGCGFVGAGLLFAKREGSKMLTYGLGGGLLTTEVVRQIDNRFYDFGVAFGDDPAITSDPTPPQLDAASVRNGITIT